jgi:hypothetical protein
MRRRHFRVFRERVIEILPAEIADVAVTILLPSGSPAL